MGEGPVWEGTRGQGIGVRLPRELASVRKWGQRSGEQVEGEEERGWGDGGAGGAKPLPSSPRGVAGGAAARTPDQGLRC